MTPARPEPRSVRTTPATAHTAATPLPDLTADGATTEPAAGRSAPPVARTYRTGTDATTAASTRATSRSCRCAPAQRATACHRAVGVVVWSHAWGCPPPHWLSSATPMRTGSPCVFNDFRRPAEGRPASLPQTPAVGSRTCRRPGRVRPAWAARPITASERRDGRPVTRQGRSEAENARSALTGRPSRSYSSSRHQPQPTHTCLRRA